WRAAGGRERVVNAGGIQFHSLKIESWVAEQPRRKTVIEARISVFVDEEAVLTFGGTLIEQTEAAIADAGASSHTGAIQRDGSRRAAATVVDEQHGVSSGDAGRRESHVDDAACADS